MQKDNKTLNTRRRRLQNALLGLFIRPLVISTMAKSPYQGLGLAIEHQNLTHRSENTASALGVLVPLLHDLMIGKEPRQTISAYGRFIRLPNITGEKLFAAYRNHKGPGNIPKEVKMATIVGISGSLRKHSFNAGLLRAAAEAVPEGCALEIESIKGIPLYDGDVEETAGIPPAVSDLKERIALADGLLMVTPENNNSIPGVFKNAIDWLTRPPEDRQRIFCYPHESLIAVVIRKLLIF